VSSSLSTSAVPARTSELFAPGMRGLTIGLILTITLVAVESLAVGTVLPMVLDELGDLPLYGWVYTAFFLGSLIGIVVSGGALDRQPLHRPFAIGVGLFAIGLVVGGLAPSMLVLVLARFVQGLGGGAVGPTAYVAIGRCMPDRLQSRMFALLSTAWVLPGVIGPSLAAVVGELAGWRWIFLGLLPLLAISSTLALTALRRVQGDAPPPAAGATTPSGGRGRLARALVAAVGAGLIVAGLAIEQLALAVAVVFAGVAILVPAFRSLTPPGTLRLARGVPAAILLRGLMTFSFFVADAFVPLLLQEWRDTPPTLTGIVFTTTTLAWSLATWLQARRIDRYGPTVFVALGFGLVALGAALTIPVVAQGVPPEISIVTWAIPGLGMGLMYSAVTLVVLRGVEPAEQGSASSSLQLADILGTALGAGIGGAITAIGGRSGPDGIGVALGVVFGVSLASALVGLLAARRIGPSRGWQEPVSAAVD
jgi:MFS family permease